MENYISGLNDDSEDEHIPLIPRSLQQQSQSTAEAGSNSVPTTILSTSIGGRGTKRRRTSWVSGAWWFLLTIQRQEQCWRSVCEQETQITCMDGFFDCSNFL
ncbi:hypothetical protein Dimus_025037 [Dionaea muscipula]